MKVLAGLLCVSTAFKAYFVSAEAFIYTSDIPPHQPREDLPSVTPLTARLLLAQRLGLSQYHSLEDADESTIQILNNYGGKQQQIFAHEDRSEGTGKLLLVVEGVANPNGRLGFWFRGKKDDFFLHCYSDIFDDSIIPAFAIDPQPSSGQNLDLAFDFLEQDRDSRTKDHNLCYLQSQNDENIRGGLSSSRIV